jgi:hypothetical protein
MQAVIKHDMLASQITRNMEEAIWPTFCGQIEFHTPTAMARVERLEKPHKAYVAMARDLSCREYNA